MAKILFTWELGSGFGHLVRYIDLVDVLIEQGHEVLFAARDVVHAGTVFADRDVGILQAPVFMQPVSDPYSTQINHAHLLHNRGLGDASCVIALIKVWRRLYDLVRPDLGVFDFSPTALLASRGCGWKRIVSGSGFLLPPSGTPMPAMTYWREHDEKRLLGDEQRLLDGVNSVLTELGNEPLNSMSQLYECDEEFLFTFEELDHYPRRTSGRYFGMFPPLDHGAAPHWPGRRELRVFAYLHPFPNLESLLSTLRAENCETLVYVPGASAELKDKYRNERLVFSDVPIAIAQTAELCRFAVTNATFGTTAAFLACGTPVLCIPTSIERIMVARRVTGMGAGLSVERERWGQLGPAIRSMCNDDAYALAARRFSERYRRQDAKSQAREMTGIIEQLLAGRAVRKTPFDAHALKSANVYES